MKLVVSDAHEGIKASQPSGVQGRSRGRAWHSFGNSQGFRSGRSATRQSSPLAQGSRVTGRRVAECGELRIERLDQFMQTPPDRLAFGDARGLTAMNGFEHRHEVAPDDSRLDREIFNPCAPR